MDQRERDAKASALELNLQAEQYSFMRRVDQHFVVENKLHEYGRDISRLSKLNQAALLSIAQQEQRLKELQSNLQPNGNTSQPNAEKKSLSPDTLHHGPPHCQTETIPCLIEKTTKQKRAKETKPHAYNQTSKCNIQTNPNPSTEAHVYQTRRQMSSQALVVTLTDVTSTSFTLSWDPCVTKYHAYDMEIRYSCTISGEPENMQLSCSRWVLKEPVPKDGRLILDNLPANTEYKDVCLRFKSHWGWSPFSDPIERIYTSERGKQKTFSYKLGSVVEHLIEKSWLKHNPANEYQIRRNQFLHKINRIKQTIQDLKKEQSTIPSKQKTLAQNMKKVQSRMLELTAEIERVWAMDGGSGDVVSSPLLHGSRQAFSKSDLEKNLQKECVTCQKQIAQWRADIIRLDQENVDIGNKIAHEATSLNQRKAGLSKLDRQFVLISKQSSDTTQYFFRRWQTKARSLREAKQTLSRLATYYRQILYRKAWRQLQLNASKKSTHVSYEGAKGIGEKLVVTAESCIVESQKEASALIRDLVATETDSLFETKSGEDLDFLDTLMSNEDLTKFALLCEDDVGNLQKGMFYLRTDRYNSALACFIAVMSKMESPENVESINGTDIITIKSAVLGKVGQAYHKLGKYDTAIVFFNRQLSLGKEIDLYESQINALLGLGNCYFSKCEFNYAHTLFHQALTAVVSVDNVPSSKKALTYSWLEKCLVALNRQNEASVVASKIQVMCDNRKERVNAALSEMDLLKQRMTELKFNQSCVVSLDVVSPNLILLQQERKKKQLLITECMEKLADSTKQTAKFSELEDHLQLELEVAGSTTKDRLVSRLINGMSQEVKTVELMRRLNDQLEVVRVKKNETINESDRIGLLIHNTKDEIARLDDRITTEHGPLMQRVLKKRNYRCMEFNKSNIAHGDVTGISKGCIELMVSTEGKELYLHNTTTGKLDMVFTGDEEGRHIGEINGHTSTITCAFFRGNRIYTGGMDCCVMGWCTKTKKKLFVGRGHEAAVTCIFADNKQLVSGSTDTTIIIWNGDNGSLLRRIHGHIRGVQHIISNTISTSNLDMVSASFDTMFCWTNTSSTPICHRCLKLHEGNVTALWYGELEIITGDSIGYLSLFWIDTGEILKYFQVHEGPILSLQCDSTKVVSGGFDKTIQIVDITKGMLIQSLRGHSQPIHDVVFDSTRILSASTDGEVHIWELANQGCPERTRLDFNKS